MTTVTRARGLAGILASAALLLVAACEVAPPTIESQIEQARQYEQKGDLRAAAIMLKNVLQKDPQHGEARFRLGLIFKQGREPRAAEHYFRRALEAKYPPREVLPLLAQSLFEQGEFEKLLEATRSSDYGEIALQPRILGLRGHSQISLGRPEDAARSFEEALKLEPDHTLSLLGQVRLAAMKGDIRVATALVDRALAADDSSLDAWLMKGELDRASGKREAALAAYQKALALNPNGLAANLNLASMHIESGQLDLARKSVDTITRTLPESAIGYYLLGLLEYRSRNFVAANEAVEKVLKSLPDHLPATALAGIVAYSAGANEQAEKRLAEAHARAPANVYLAKAYAAALLRSGKARDALKVLEPALKASPQDPVVLALFGEAKLETRDVAAAKKYFELSAKQSPQDPRIRSGLGLARLAAGDTDKALADLEAAADLGTGMADVFLARHYIAARQYDKALATVSHLESKRPTDPATFNLKGAVLFAKNDVAGARKAFERAAELQPGRFAATANLARLDARDGGPIAARKRFEKILDGDPGNAQAMLALSDIAVATRNLDEAIAWAERAKLAQPKAFGPSMALARLHLAKGSFPEAIAAAKDAVAADPDSAEALNILGYSQLRTGQSIAALETYSTLAARYPRSAEALYGLANAQSANGRLGAAETSLTKALALRPNFPEAMYALSALYLRAGKVSDAGKLIGEAHKRLPESPLASVMAGDAAMAGKRYEQAVRAYEAAFEKERSQPVLSRLHAALLAAGRNSAAEALTAEWLQKNPGDIQVRYLVASTAIRSGNFRAAAEQYEYVLRTAKEEDKLPLLHNLGLLYDRLNDPRALEVAESAYKIAPERPGVIFDLARAVMKKGDTDRAIGLLEKARMLSPESQLVRYDLAKAYLRIGASGQARLELEQLLRGGREFAERAEAEELLRKLKN